MSQFASSSRSPALPDVLGLAEPPTPEAPPPELVVFSHLRWSWVWQRPQHLISRLAASHRVWFVEEPYVDLALDQPELRWSRDGAVTIVRLHVPGPERHLGFDTAGGELLGHHVAEAAGAATPHVWLYTPLALPAAELLSRRTLVFDVMDDLAAFKNASPALRARHQEAVATADVVFTGGRSLHLAVSELRRERTYLFPSGVETEHYASAITRRRVSGRPVAGYVGVIDERLDLDLVASLADRLPDWDIRMVGPVAKIDPADLPQRDNICYDGPVSYRQLPDTMAGFHVALMPFALNEATRSISPTKTLEYLAAGLPVVSTRIRDVVDDYGHVVHFADDADGFASGCREVLGTLDDAQRLARNRPLLEWHHWDRIAQRMNKILRTFSEWPAGFDELERTA
jgi:glycosyltransferase involved in cell wall biosynthesis